jgi:hypothetical protein
VILRALTRPVRAVLMGSAISAISICSVFAEDLATASARIQVKPRAAEVYVDGYLVGTVDKFDGFFQRLQVPAGEHELTLYLEGYKTYRQKVLFPPDTAFDIKYQLQPLVPGESQEPRPEAPPNSHTPSAESPFEASWFDETPPVPSAAEHPPSGFGTLAVRVQPAGATILIDGQEWKPSHDANPLSIELHEGDHEIEVSAEGLSTFRKNVRMRAGETVSLNVSLVR